MKELEKKFWCSELSLEDLTLKDYFKIVLKTVLIEEPPKRMHGNSGWIYSLQCDLSKAKILKSNVKPCCDKWCEEEAPCGYDCDISDKEYAKQMKALIDSL